MDSISDVLYFQERFMDPSLNTGLWWCLDYDDMEAASVNAVCKAMSASWGEVAQGLDPGFIPIYVATTRKDAHNFVERWQREHLEGGFDGR